jgi:RND family efflux transporter MFP subunit
MSRSILFIFLIFFSLSLHAATNFQTQPLSKIAFSPERTAAAQVVSLNESTLSAEITARVKRIIAEPGQTVTKGALLAQLDCSDYALASERAAATLRASEAQTKVAELQLARNQQLAEKNFISAASLDTELAQTESTRAEVAVSRSNLKTAQNAEKKCSIYAPFPAVVLARIANEGEIVTTGSPLITARDLSRLEVRADIQDKDTSLKNANKIVFRSNGKDYSLRLIRLSPALSLSTRLREARLRFISKAALSGSSGRLIWDDPTPHLSAKIIVRRNGRLGVFIIKQDKPHFLVLPNAEEGRPVAVPNLAAETHIVIQGQDAL